MQKQKEIKKIALIGAGRIGTIIAEKMIKPSKQGILERFFSISSKHGQEFVIIDSDDALTKAASERFPDARVLRADASDEAFLKEEGINIGLYNMRFLKPLDTELLDNIAKQYKKIITIEDGTKIGGFGWSVKDYLTKNHSVESIICLGVEDKFVEQGSIKELQKLCGLDVSNIIAQVRTLL